MKVLLISPQESNPKGGIAVWTNAYLEGCVSCGLDVTVVNTATIGTRAKNGTARRNFLDEITRTKRILHDLKFACRSTSFDVAHLNTSCATFGVIRDFFIAKRIKKKNRDARLVVHYHCDISFQVRNRLSKHYLKKLSRLADTRLVLCENSRRYLMDNFTLESHKTPNFIDAACIRSDEKAIRPTLEKVFFVGRVSRAKGAAEIYEVAKSFPDIHFELAGTVSEDVSAWSKPENITLLGSFPHDNVLHYMDAADIFLFPTHSEGFSVALMEAMARGLPAIATDVGANADMLANDRGIIVPKGNVTALVHAINRLRDPVVRKELSNASVVQSKNYTTEKVMQLLYTHYRPH